MTPDSNNQHQEPHSTNKPTPHIPPNSEEPALTPPAESEEVSKLRAQGAELSASTQQVIDLQIARTFVESAPTLFGTLASITFPSTMHDPQTIEVHTSKEFDFRSQLIEERNAIHQLLLQGKEIAERLLPALREEEHDLVSQIVSHDLRELVDQVDQTFERIEDLHAQILNETTDLKVRQFPGQKAIESQLGRKFDSFAEYTAFRDELIGHDPEALVHAPIQFARSFWQFVQHRDEERSEVDINTVVASDYLVGGAQKIHLSESSPLAAARPADFATLLHGVQLWAERTISDKSREHLKTLGKDNKLFDMIAEEGFLSTSTGQFLSANFMQPRESEVFVFEDGGVEIELPASEEVILAVQEELSAMEGFPAALRELASRNNISFQTHYSQDRVFIKLLPISLDSQSDEAIERLKLLLPADELGLPEVDEFGIPQSDPLEDVSDPEEMQAIADKSFVLLPRRITTPDGKEREYLLGVQGAGIQTAEAGQKIKELAPRIDEYMNLLPDMKSVALQKISVRPKQDEEGNLNMVVEARFAMPLQEAYNKGKFDFITFGSQVNREPDPTAWSKRIEEVLQGTLPWANEKEGLPKDQEIETMEEHSAESTASDSGELGGFVTIDSSTFHDDNVLETIRRIGECGHFRRITLYEGFLTEISEEHTDSPITPAHLLSQVEKIVSDISPNYPEGDLVFSIGAATVPTISLKDNLSTALKFEALNSDNEVVVKGHLEVESGNIRYRDVEPADRREFINRVERAVEQIQELHQTKKADVHDIVHALESENVRISELVTALTLIGFTRKHGEGFEARKVIERMLEIPGVYVDRDDSDTLIMRRYENDELRSS